MGIWGQSLRVIKKVSLPGLCSGHIPSWKPSGLVDGSAEGRTLCSCHLPSFLTTEKLCLVQLHRSLSLEAKFPMETQGPLLREASSVHTFISFPISEVLTGLRILGGNRSRVKLLGKQATKYIRSQGFPGMLCSKRWRGGPCWAGCWRVRVSVYEPWTAGSVPAWEGAWRGGNRAENVLSLRRPLQHSSEGRV